MMGAHPDDENADVLVCLSRGRKARTAYLSLTRGEGGQNLLGPEQNELLGVIRTQELAAARAIDGAEQYFTRAIDFGFSRSADDTLAKWGREAVLSDVVWIIRRFRPDVIVRTLTGTPGDPHAHHHASDQLAAEAFVAAADARRFPDQLNRLKPWRATRLVQILAGPPARGPAIEIDATRIEPVEGVTYSEIARRSRAMHRSQGFDSPARKVSPRWWLAGIAGQTLSNDIFDHIDTTWNRLPGGAAVGRMLDGIAREFDPQQPEQTVRRLAEVRPLAAAIEDPWAKLKLREMDEVIAQCRGLSLKAVSQAGLAVPGAVFDASLEGLDQRLAVTVPPDLPYSQPYWLRQPHGPCLYTVEDQELIGLPDSPAALSVPFRITAGDAEIEFQRPVLGPGGGPVAVVPPVSVKIPEPVHLFPDDTARQAAVLLLSHAGAVSGELVLEMPAGWAVDPASSNFEMERAGGQATLWFTLTPPAGQAHGVCRAAARIAGKEIASGVVEAGYPGLSPRVVLIPAQTTLVRADVRTLARNIGYLMGSGDDVPRALRQMGCEVTLIGEQDLARGRLERFDAIVAGVRAFNVRPDLRANRSRLLEYVQAGGTWVVQYNVANRRAPEQVAAIGPYPLRIGRGRVTSPDAPVTFLDRSHSLLNSPNKLGEEDFRGWVQERGLYFGAEWDARYTALFECHEPGDKPLHGATLYVRHGRGAYVFTAFSWFRQLPAGVAGAYRIFANLLSAARTSG